MTHSQGAVIRDNLLLDNRGGWAVHLYPDADGTLVEGNVIDSNEGGVIFAGDGGGNTSDGNVVRENVITNSAPRWNIEGSWSGGPEGKGNLAQRNCLYSAGPGSPSGIGFLNGFEQSGNVVAKGPVYVDRAGGDYRLRPGSNCGGRPRGRRRREAARGPALAAQRHRQAERALGEPGRHPVPQQHPARTPQRIRRRPAHPRLGEARLPRAARSRSPAAGASPTRSSAAAGCGPGSFANRLCLETSLATSFAPSAPIAASLANSSL